MTEDITRADYDPLGTEEHRIPPVVEPERTPISAAPSQQGAAEPTPVVIGEARTPAVTGRMHDRPHFIRNVDGVEVCGQCAQPWPCEEFMRDHPEALADSAGSALVSLADVAAATGLTPAEIQARMAGRG